MENQSHGLGIQPTKFITPVNVNNIKYINNIHINSTYSTYYVVPSMVSISLLAAAIIRFYPNKLKKFHNFFLFFLGILRYLYIGSVGEDKDQNFEIYQEIDV